MSSNLVQLATDWRGGMLETGWLVEPKVDGWRAAWFPGIDGEARLWTRNGLPIEGVPHIAYRLRQMEAAAGRPIMFDGEFQVDRSLAATKAWCERGWKFGGEAGRLYLFDAMPVEQWRAGGSDVPALLRKNWLVELWQAVEDDPALSWEWRPGSYGRDEGNAPVVVVPHVSLVAQSEIVDLAREVWAEGGEGLMLKDPSAPYRCLRTKAWQKVKGENAHHWAHRLDLGAVL